MNRSHVRLVTAEEKASPRKLSLKQAIESGSYLEILLAQRRDIVAALSEAKGPAAAALHRQLSLLSQEIVTQQSVSDSAHSVVANTPDEPWDESKI